MIGALKTCHFGLAACLLPLAGCAVWGDLTGLKPSSRDLFLAYSDKVDARVRELSAYETPEGGLLFTSDSPRNAGEVAAAFRTTLREYEVLLSELKPKWSDCRLASLKAALERSAELHAALRERIHELSRTADHLQGQYQELKVEAESSEKKINLKPSFAYLSICQDLSDLSSRAFEYLSAVHADELVEHDEAKQAPAGVYHFLRLQELQRPDLSSYVNRYEAAWRQWIRSEIKRGELDSAMSVFLFVATAARKQRLASLQELFEITHAALEKSPPLGSLERMEASLTRLEEALRADGGGPGDWRNVIRRSRGILLFCRARATSDPDEAVSLALQGFQLNSNLSTHFVAFLGKAAERSGEKKLAAGSYSEAVASFKKVVSLGQVSDADGMTADFRSKVVAQALQDAQRDTDKGRFTSAKAILAQAASLCESQSERRKLREGLRSFYHRYAAHLVEHDFDKAAPVCQEMLETFPDDEAARRLADQVSYRLLVRDLGSPETTYERFGADGVLELIRGYDQRMASANGSESCQKVFQGVEEAWRRRLNQTKDLQRAFALSQEVAKLAHTDPATEGAKVVFRLVSGADQRDWDQAEKGIELYFSKSPHVPRPDSFRQAHLGLIRHLDTQGNAAKLARHVGYLLSAYPSEAPSLKQMLVKYLAADDASSGTIYSLLRSIDPRSPEVKRYEKLAGIAPEEIKETPAESGEKEPAGAAGWWKKEPQPAPRPTPSWIPRAPKAEREEEGRSPLLIVVLTAGGVLFGGLVAGRTFQKGLLGFTWYAAAAFWVGLGVGFILGG